MLQGTFERKRLQRSQGIKGLVYVKSLLTNQAQNQLIGQAKPGPSAGLNTGDT